jgi:hypothetical protein
MPVAHRGSSTAAPGASRRSGNGAAAGFADAAIAARGEARQPNEARARARLQAILEARFDAAALARMLIDGSSLGEEDACRLALRA